MLKLAWHTALRDLRGGLRHLRLFFACLALGVAMLACIGSIVWGIKAGIGHDAKALTGGDLEIRQLYNPVGKKLRAWLSFNSTEVSRTMDTRTMARSRDRQVLIDFKAIDAYYPLYGTLDVTPKRPLHRLLRKEGNTHGVLVEETLLKALNVKRGDTIKIGDARYVIRGIIKTEPDRTINGFSFGMRVMTSMPGFRESGLIQPGSMINFRYRVKLPETTPLQEWKTSLRDQFPQGAWSVRDYREAVPAVTDMLDRVALFFSLTGIATLITAGIGISNATSVYLRSKQRTIAILKCHGAPQRMIYATYLIQLIAVALIAILLGLALGTGAQMLLMQALHDVLPVRGLSGVYAEPLLLAAGFGLIIVLLFSMRPLAATAHIKPAGLLRGADDDPDAPPPGWRSAFAAGLMIIALIALAVRFTNDRNIPLYFTGGLALSLLLLLGIGRGVERITRVYAKRIHTHRPTARNMTLSMALSNLSRPHASTTAIVVALGVGMSLMVALAQVGSSLRNQIEAGLPETAPSLFLLDIQPYEADAIRQQLLAVSGVHSVEQTPMLRGRLSKINNTRVEYLPIDESARWAVRGDRGLTWSDTPPAHSDIVEGTWWPKDYKGPPLLSFDAKLARGMNVKIGDMVTYTVMGRDITAKVANLRTINWGTLDMNFASILSPGAEGDLPATILATVYTDKDADWAVQDMLMRQFPGVSAIRVRDTLDKIASMLVGISGAVLFTAALTILCGVLVMASAVSASLHRRIYDTVILKVIGVTRNTIMRIHILEFALLALVVAGISGIIGTVSAYGVMQLMIFSEFSVSFPVLLATLGFCLLLSLTIGLAATHRALGVKPLSLLRNE